MSQEKALEEFLQEKFATILEEISVSYDISFDLFRVNFRIHENPNLFFTSFPFGSLDLQKKTAIAFHIVSYLKKEFPNAPT